MKFVLLWDTVIKVFHKGVETSLYKIMTNEIFFTGPKPACRISEGAAKWDIRDRVHRRHQNMGGSHQDKNTRKASFLNTLQKGLASY
jgi:hypothetical protein